MANVALALVSQPPATPDPTSFAAARMLLMRCPAITGDYLREHSDCATTADVATAIDLLRSP
jgi:hypothetical protein